MTRIKDNISLSDVVCTHGITLDQARNLRDGMNRTFSQIHYDLLDCFENEEEFWNCYADRAAAVAENTLDADRVTTFCPDMDLDWVYRLPNGEWRHNVIEMGEQILRAI